MSSDVPLYDVFGARYDLMINWEARLKRETPYFKELFERYNVQSVLDSACGTGQHAALFASWGLDVVGADPSAEMIRVAQDNAGSAAEFVQAGFGEMAAKLNRRFDAVVCLGNSLPHLLTRGEICVALEDMASVLRQDGLLVIHNNNYDRILALRERFMPLSSATSEDGIEYLFFRFFDLDDNVLGFNIATFARSSSGWQVQVDSTRHRALRADELGELVAEAGLREIERWGSFYKEPYDQVSSDNLILTAIRPGDS